MEAFTTHTGTAVALQRSNVDTDQIIPAVYLKRVTRTGFEDGLFAAWRSDPDFVLNRPESAGATILMVIFLWGILGVQKETVLASSRSIVTVEEIVQELEPRPGAVVIPGWAISAVAVVPHGAHPSYAHGYYNRDNAFYVAWDEISRDRERFQEWMQRHVLDTADVNEYRASIGAAEVAL